MSTDSKKTTPNISTFFPYVQSAEKQVGYAKAHRIKEFRRTLQQRLGYMYVKAANNAHSDAEKRDFSARANELEDILKAMEYYRQKEDPS